MNMGTVAAIGYARISSDDQKIQLQIDELERAGCSQIFSDRRSGATAGLTRPGLADALSHLRPGDTLVVWKLDRLGRSVQHLVSLIAGLKIRGVNFRSLTENIDTATPMGQFFFHIMASFAEMERGLIQERTRAGLAAARARGRVGGRPRLLTAGQIVKARRYFAAGLGASEIAAMLRVSVPTIYRAIPAEERQIDFETAPA